MDEKYHEQASELELHRRAEGLRQVREQMLGPGQPDCKDCGEPIPCNRRKAAPGAIRCIACQNNFETASKK